ncbi:hypothetical protein DL96DRAFT_925374 [Flagelloscypha sp. PMI_526]|nr:hypothetical protein DL96DRAFT_925374 [Flagelloscypha sp. PMI_526]
MTSNRSGRPRSLRTLAFGSAIRQSQNDVNRPPSPSFSEVTNASNINLANGPEKIITRNDLKHSSQAYEDLMTASANYRNALTMMSEATTAFADAMQACSLLKGASYEAGTRLQVASGLHHLIGNQWLVLAQTLDRKFEKPLRQHLESYRTIIKDRSTAYERALREKSQIIRDTENRNLNRKERNLQSFREALAVLQRQVDELDELKASHYTEILEHEEEVWNVVQNKMCLVLRSEMDVFDRIVGKASDPVIEPMLLAIPDPFDSYGPPPSEDQIFSILAPLSLTPSTSLSVAASGKTTPTPSTGGAPIPDWLNGMHYDRTEDAEDQPDNIETDEEYESTSRPISPSRSASTSPPTPSPPFAKQSRKDSKLRSVLAVIDETHQHQHRSRIHNSNPGTPPASESDTTSPWATDFDFGTGGGGSINGTSTDDRDRTPRHSMLYAGVDHPQSTEALLSVELTLYLCQIHLATTVISMDSTELSSRTFVRLQLDSLNLICTHIPDFYTHVLFHILTSLVACTSRNFLSFLIKYFDDM